MKKRSNNLYIISLAITFILSLTAIAVGLILMNSNNFELWRNRAGEPYLIKLILFTFMLPAITSLIGITLGIISILKRNITLIYTSSLINSIFDIYWVLVILVILCEIINLSFVSVPSFIVNALILTTLLSINFIGLIKQKKLITNK